MRNTTEKLMSDRTAFGSVDPVEAVLYLTAKYTLLPEIFDLFGRDKVLQFLERFGGRTIKVPSMKSVEEALLQLSLWKELQKNSTPENIKRLAAVYGIRESDVRNASVKVQDMIDAKTTFTQRHTASNDGTAATGDTGSTARELRPRRGRKPAAGTDGKQQP